MNSENEKQGSNASILIKYFHLKK